MADVAAASELSPERLRAAEHLLRLKKAANDLIIYTELTMPDPEHYDDPSRSKYDVQPHQRLLAEALQKVDLVARS